MTTQSYKRCAQCGIEYTYTGSGYGCMEPYNNSTWCKDCAKVVQDALKTVPRLFECRYQDIKEIPHLAAITLSQVLGWEKEAKVEREREGGWPVRRVFCPLFDLTNGDAQSVREIVGREAFRSYRFKVATWDISKDYSIEVPMEYDITKECFTNHDWPHYIRRPG